MFVSCTPWHPFLSLSSFFYTHMQTCTLACTHTQLLLVINNIWSSHKYWDRSLVTFLAVSPAHWLVSSVLAPWPSIQAEQLGRERNYSVFVYVDHKWLITIKRTFRSKLRILNAWSRNQNSFALKWNLSSLRIHSGVFNFMPTGHEQKLWLISSCLSLNTVFGVNVLVV